MKKHIAIIYPAGNPRLGTIEEEKIQRESRIAELAAEGFYVSDILPQQKSLDGCTSAPVLERATLLGHALTQRKYDILMAARGGVGCTELIPYLENLLPPVLAEKTLVGFSDVSFLGVYLALRYPNIRYIHGQMAFAHNFFTGSNQDKNCLFDLFKGIYKPYFFIADCQFDSMLSKVQDQIQGSCLPVNLSLAESLASIRFLRFDKKDYILFIEDCNEHLYKIIRKFDSLINSGFMSSIKAVVLGAFTGCFNAANEPLDRLLLIQVIAKKLRVPIIVLPVFGHGEERFPLVMNSIVQIKIYENKAELNITNEFIPSASISTNFSPELFCKKIDPKQSEKIKLHLTGIGGTGMAQVAGLLLSAGYTVSGSDTPIYPPMDKLIADMGIHPDIGFLTDNIYKHRPDAIIMANVVSRLSASLKKNDELEEILSQNIPVLSFPAALRKYFLHKSCNIVVSGTHGKTTTSSLITFLLHQLGFKPSFLIGGRPANFSAGYSLNSRKLFVLEGDEYDSAFFDKGPKFLHYEPKICLINNIEFDHADIYNNVEAIEAEFLRLARLTKDRNGVVVANADDERVRNIVQISACDVVWFGRQKPAHSNAPFWQLLSTKTNLSGITVLLKQPDGLEVLLQSGIFGEHNAMNSVAACATLFTYSAFDSESLQKNRDYNYDFMGGLLSVIPNFKGVKRRFELLAEKNGIIVFDDFAHHPTAIVTTLQAFRDYMLSSGRTGRLIVCFDPRNATMRRNIMQEDLGQSFTHADLLFLGKVPQDLRIQHAEVLNIEELLKSVGSEKSRYFDDNERLFKELLKCVQNGDTVVFMSSGSFDGIPHKFADAVLSS